MATEREWAERAAAGDVAAFTELVRAHQAMAFGYALAVVRDFHLAQDATQEAFVAAYFGLPKLRDRAKFVEWLRGIVRYQCRRVQRRRTEPPLDDAVAAALPAPGPTPEGWSEEREGTDELLAAIGTLPETLLTVARLFYLEERSQREVAIALGLPVTTVNNRLHAARRRLQQRRLAMMPEDVRRCLPDDFAATVVEMIRARGPVIDLRFPEASPAVLSMVEIGERSGDGSPLRAGVMQQLPDGVTRCLVLTPTGDGAGLASSRSVTVRVEERPSEEWATPGAIRRALAALGGTGREERQLETGVKAIDLLCPLAFGGAVGIFGDAGAGKAVLIGELLHNLGAALGAPTLFAFVERGEEATFMHGVLPRVPVTDPMRQAMYVATEQARALDEPELVGAFDAIVSLSRAIVGLHVFPAVDSLRSSSRLLTPAIVGDEHYRVAGEVRDLLARYPAAGEAAGAGVPALDDTPAWRSRQLRRFLGQPMFLAADFTKLPGQAVPLAETIRGCDAILRGDCDGFPLEAFWMVGTLDEVVQKAARLGRAGGSV